MLLFIRQIFYSFPIQLLLLHLRSSLLLLLPWVLLLLMMSGLLGRRLGTQYLFLNPEYLGQVDSVSFFVVGLALGGFFMSWNLTTYLLTAQYFPFLASLSRPFTKFSINNLLLPFTFGGFYLFLIGYFQYEYQGVAPVEIALHLLALVLGSLSMVFLYALYFTFTNRDISYYKEYDNLPTAQVAIAPGSRKVDLDYIKLDRNRINVWTYLGENLRPRLVRSVAHYDSVLLLNIFRQNHLNALALQLFSMVVLLALGYLIDWEFFRIPAAASVIILFSLIVAFMGALTYWFAEWRVFLIMVLLVFINHLTTFPLFNNTNKAYGLDYEGKPAPYNYEQLRKIGSDEQVNTDKAATRAILNRRIKGKKKPKVVFLCASGGGLKAATWSTHILQVADSLTKGKLLDQTVLMTGASGGMLGMAYLREQYLRQSQGAIASIYDARFRDSISMDMLNAIAFTLVSNDLFLPWRRFSYAGEWYYKDRGYIFERQFNENTNGILDKPLMAYQAPEQSGRIPLLYLTPAIVNDGRQMVISPQGAAFMMIPPVGRIHSSDYEVDMIDFRLLLAQQRADSLGFLTALRMNASYPYILPTVRLPTEPELALVDAGFRDNYGVQTATRFIQVFQDWIWTNTSGVVIVQISSSEKSKQIPTHDEIGVVESLIRPLGIAGKVLTIQEFQHNNTLSYIHDILGDHRFDLIKFTYHPANDNKLEASVSFHLTQQERQDVLRALALPENVQSMKRLVEVLR